MDVEVLIDDLINDEGIRLKAYRCTAGKLTIGIGRNLDDKGLSIQEIMYLCKNDINEILPQLQKLTFWNELNSPRQEVLVNMAFNLGVDGLLKFKKTLELISKKEYEKASAEMLRSKWANQVGKRAIRLSKVMRSGERA